MIIFYSTITKKIQGVSMILNDSSKLVKEPTFASSFPQSLPPDMGYFFTPNDPTIANALSDYQLVMNNTGKPVGIEMKPPKPYIELSTDATDRDGNGIPEIPANGKATCNITASIRDNNGRLLVDEERVVEFETTNGILFEKSVKTRNGIAKTVLRSVEETVTPKIIAKSEGCFDGNLRLEFVIETSFNG